MKRLLISLLLMGCATTAPAVSEPTIQSGSSVLTTLRWVKDNAQRFDFGETGGVEFESSIHWDTRRTHGFNEGWYVDTENHGRLWVLLSYTYNTDRRWHVGSVMTTYDETPSRDYICGGSAGEEC